MKRAIIQNYKPTYPENDYHQTDFTILGFRKKSEYEKGRKVYTEYLDNDNIIVKKTFTDLENENGRFNGIKILFEWYGENGEPVDGKEELVYMDNYEASIHLQKRRERAIGYLSFSAKGTEIEEHLDTIFEHYDNEIDKFITTGSNKFREAVENEADTEIIQLLDIEVPREDGTGMITVRDSILHAI